MILGGMLCGPQWVPELVFWSPAAHLGCRAMRGCRETFPPILRALRSRCRLEATGLLVFLPGGV